MLFTGSIDCFYMQKNVLISDIEKVTYLTDHNYVLLLQRKNNRLVSLNLAVFIF